VSGFAASVDPLGYNNVVGPVENQILSDITTSSLGALIVAFVFSFKQAASCSVSYPERKTQTALSGLFVFLIPTVCTPPMMLKNNLLWRSLKLVLLALVLLYSIITFTSDFLRVRAVLLQQLGIGHSALKPEVRKQLRRLVLFAMSVYSIGGFAVVILVYMTIHYLHPAGTSSFFTQDRFTTNQWTRGFAFTVTGAPSAYPLLSVVYRALQYLAVACPLYCFCRIEPKLGSRPGSALQSIEQGLIDDDRQCSVASHTGKYSHGLPTREGEADSSYSVNENDSFYESGPLEESAYS
jgi:hypothetical protein